MAGGRAEGYQSRQAELSGWPVRISSWRLAERWRCEVDNVDPGAVIARAEGTTREAAETAACEKAAARLARTRTF
ncbi:hypothetical protein SH611_14480 [Geminicoccaceae bacterium 1502E]|nr:hypothetical protein [Geminicoccaceae bacterium 1502E]